MARLLARLSPLLLILTLAVLLVQGSLFSPSPWVIAGQVLGLALIASARAAFGTRNPGAGMEPGDKPFVRRGPYRFIRHPMYTGGIVFLTVTIAGHLSILHAALGLVVLASVTVRIALEEAYLREHYPQYADYCRATKRLVPYVF